MERKCRSSNNPVRDSCPRQGRHLWPLSSNGVYIIPTRFLSANKIICLNSSIFRAFSQFLSNSLSWAIWAIAAKARRWKLRSSEEPTVEKLSMISVFLSRFIQGKGKRASQRFIGTAFPLSPHPWPWLVLGTGRLVPFPIGERDKPAHLG